MPSYHFVIWLEGSSELTEELENRVYEAGCDDALLGLFDSRLCLEFDREADTPFDAVKSAIQDVKSAGLKIAGIGTGDHDLVTSAEAARRTGLSRANVSQLQKGIRGPGIFPRSMLKVSGRPVWPWHKIRAWYEQRTLAKRKKAVFSTREMTATTVCGNRQKVEIAEADRAEIELQGVVSAYQLVKGVPERRRSQIIGELEELVRD